MDSGWARRPELRTLARVALGLGVSVALLRPPAAGGAEVLACPVPVEVDGNLLCGAEVTRALAAACGTVPPTRPGDALETPGACAGAASRRLPPDDLAALSVPVDVNRDTVADLTSLPGIGPVIAGRIVAGRPYGALEDLLAVRGIGPVRLARIRPRVEPYLRNR